MKFLDISSSFVDIADTNDLTEYYKFMYQYKNDCLSASIEFNKDYYDDRELKPNKSLLFRLNIIPRNI